MRLADGTPVSEADWLEAMRLLLDEERTVQILGIHAHALNVLLDRLQQMEARLARLEGRVVPRMSGR